ncbi:hypothetical protein BC940DRAFT_308171 [Gongronella butleri]|nr:hypothetical protein BC940DRAFT_308171 [Gongronella butleri]
MIGGPKRCLRRLSFLFHPALSFFCLRTFCTSRVPFFFPFLFFFSSALQPFIMMDVSSTKVLTAKEMQIVNNQVEIEWLKTQIAARRQALESTASVNGFPLGNLTDEQVQVELEQYSQTIGRRRAQMDLLTQFNQTKDTLSRSLDKSHLTLQALFPDEPLSEGDAMSMKKRQTEQLILERDKLVVQANQLLDQLNDVTQEITDIRHKINDVRLTSRQITEELEKVRRMLVDPTMGNSVADTMSVSSTQTNERTKEKLRDAKNRLEITRNILLGLILESNIDWASDPKWAKVMYTIGKEEDF